MSKMTKMSMLLFVLFLILVIQPSFLNNLYSTILGRIVLIVVVLFFAMNNVTLGLLSALIIIISSNMFFMEGLETMDPTTTPTTTTKDKIQEVKDKVKEATGVDLETIKDTIQSKESATLPVASTANNEVMPADPSKETFGTIGSFL
jgi:membrane protein implicated in regulation of membrane protease activity